MACKEFTKEDEKLLRAYADKLPCVMENTVEFHRLKGSEIIEMGYVVKDGVNIEPKKTYEWAMPVKIAVNHYRRLKNAWLKQREKGVNDYLHKIASLMKKETENAEA